MDALKELRNLDKDDILAALGLQTKRSAAEYALPIVGLLSAGILVGVGLGLLVAPKAGSELRQQLGKGVSNVRDRALSSVEEVTAQSH